MLLFFLLLCYQTVVIFFGIISVYALTIAFYFFQFVCHLSIVIVIVDVIIVIIIIKIVIVGTIIIKNKYINFHYLSIS